ncbi:family 43 glycosylhydrolase [Paenibacillus prosopidis]|uniref:Beta-xylosidase n=1 Tax=Paenibacillus prosopidis TaxID=630520 RepID=A0A368W735_9BACL|nr:family 43 glycosylhydrolase [Paenibacillus prosopidis]RCW49646.1 beta-xylosidase [Paenibacillus prosopidis]
MTKDIRKGDLGNGTYRNPVLAGDYADPSVLRVGNDYYMTHSSFTFTPGLLIWHSKDLVNWRPVGKALDHNIGDVWAPDFIVYEGTYYIYVPVDGKIVALTATAPEGPWSEPVQLGLEAIDPGHVIDQEGNRYLHTGGGYMNKLSNDGLSIEGETIHVYDGWEFPDEWVVEGKFLESPKLFYRNGYYYLTSAQGGTSGPPTSHMVISARSKNPWGPFENSPYNPVIRTQSRDERWYSKGHGTLVDTPNGEWWILYHAYEKNNYPLGRQTLLEPIEWTADGWFRVPEDISTDQPIAKPEGAAVEHGLPHSDSFTSDRLGLQWSFFKQHDKERYAFTGDAIVLQASEVVSPLVFMPEDHNYEVTVEVAIEAGSQGRLLLFYNQMYYSGMGISEEGIYGILRGWPAPCIPFNGKCVHMRLRNLEHEVIYFYSHDGSTWRKLPHSFEASGFHHNALGGFLALRIGLDTCGEGQVMFKNFQYRSL